ncbi:MAG TPA: hypothetical protein VMF05_05990 [Stellaceae bacterium]|nr:hypothetical protein [Stellaceae bacterium]
MVGQPGRRQAATAPETVGLRQRRGEIEADRSAAETALPAAQARSHEAALRLAAAARQRAEVLPAAAADAALSIIPALRAAVARVLRIQAIIAGTELALREAGQRPGAPSSFMHHSMEIANAIRAARQEVVVSADVAAGRQLLDRLVNDPAAALEPPV